MNYVTWCRRLTEQLPGWHVWTTSPGPRWRAVPAPADEPLRESVLRPGQIEARTPQQLRDLCRDRYGWDDYCDTCNVLARECGHRSPETPSRP